MPEATTLPADAESSDTAIRFLEDKVKRNPEDFIAYNKLAGYYLQQQRETGSIEFIDLAARAASASLKVLPAEQNRGGLAAMAQVEIALHEFASARERGELLLKLDPQRLTPYQILGDSLIELGDYDRAIDVVQKAQRIGGPNVGTEARLARIALLQGKTEFAMKHLADALIIALDHSPSRETVAWCRWQLGEAAFLAGDYGSAERHFRDALTTFPRYYRALGSLGKVLAARRDLAGAIEQYEHAVRIVPDPVFIAALGDAYKLTGKDAQAQSQYALVEQIARLGKLGGALYNRQLALFYADHDLKAEDAYQLAIKEYEARRDIYGADAVAWTALKAGKIAEAQSAIKEALRLGTRDAKLFYHAGMIYRAAGESARAREYLDRALKLSPGFDPLQAVSAKRALEEL